jgi:hypothetical protein
MLATGTLAQGLNLPATLVVVGGTDVGDRRESRTPEGRVRSLAQLVNAIGRAGRPTVASRSAALVVPSEPIWLAGGAHDIELGLARAEVLSSEDAALRVGSPLASLVTAALRGDINPDGMSVDELTAFSYLPVTDPERSAVSILSRSYGVWLTAPDELTSTASAVDRALHILGEGFMEGTSVPSWTGDAATRSGLSLLEIFSIFGTLRDIDRAFAEFPLGVARGVRQGDG